jgi:hypothetical protein
MSGVWPRTWLGRTRQLGPEDAPAVEPKLADAEGWRVVPNDRRMHCGML